MERRERILSEEWVRESVTDKMDSENNTHYGYQWKTTTSLDGTRRIFFASGTGGQFIACVPSLDAVVVTTAKFNKANGEKIAKLLLTQVLPAISAQ